MADTDPYAFTFLLRTMSGNNCRYAYTADVVNLQMQICNIRTPLQTPRMRLAARHSVTCQAAWAYTSQIHPIDAEVSTPLASRLDTIGA